MSEDPMESLRDALLRREWTPDEKARVAEWLARHSAESEAWREDEALGRLLRRLPPAPMSSNFTARVMAEVRREGAQAPETKGAFLARRGLWDGWRRLLPITALGLLLAGSLAMWDVRRDQRRLAEAEGQRAALRVLAEIPPLALEDFEVIRKLGDHPAPVDFELLAALE